VTMTGGDHGSWDMPGPGGRGDFAPLLNARARRRYGNADQVYRRRTQSPAEPTAGRRRSEAAGLQGLSQSLGNRGRVAPSLAIVRFMSLRLLNAPLRLSKEIFSLHRVDSPSLLDPQENLED
jgi:hypothetical protein